MNLNLPAWAIILVAVAGGLAWVFGVISLEFYTAALGVVGVAGLAGLAALINSSGIKRWITVAIAVLALVGSMFGFLSPDVVTALFALAGVSAPFTFGHAIQKTPQVGAALRAPNVQ